MLILQVDSPTNETNLMDNLFWPLAVAFIIFIAGLIFQTVRKRISKKANDSIQDQTEELKIKINTSDSKKAFHEKSDYLILNTTLINKTRDPINNIRLSVEPKLPIMDGIQHLVRFSRSEGVVVLPFFHDFVDDVILNEPLSIPPLNDVQGNIVLGVNDGLPDRIILTFSYLDYVLTKELDVKEILETVNYTFS